MNGLMNFIEAQCKESPLFQLTKEIACKTMDVLELDKPLFSSLNDTKKSVSETTGWSDKIMDFIGSIEEAKVYIEAKLDEVEINGQKCLIKNDISLKQEDEDGISNKDRMERGRPPITRSGEEVELHHIGQKRNSPLAELTTNEHRGIGNDTILHDKNKESEIDRYEFAKERREHWKNRLESMNGGV